MDRFEFSRISPLFITSSGIVEIWSGYANATMSSSPNEGDVQLIENAPVSSALNKSKNRTSSKKKKKSTVAGGGSIVIPNPGQVKSGLADGIYKVNQFLFCFRLLVII